MTPEEQRAYNRHRAYNSIPAPKENPCTKCRLDDRCHDICPARARWWDVFREKILKNGGNQNAD